MQDGVEDLCMEDLLKKYEIASDQRNVRTLHKSTFANQRRTKSKGAPLELPAKCAPPFFQRTQPKSKANIDPRFDSRAGVFKRSQFKQQYSFLDEVKRQEMNFIQSALDEEDDDPEKVEQLKGLLRRMKDQVKAEENLERSRKVIVDLRKENMLRMKEGKKPIYKTRAQIKQQLQESKMAELKAKGKLDKYLERKERKKASKKLPFSL